MEKEENKLEQEHQGNQENQKQDKNSSETPLFRQEVIQAKKGSYFGQTLIVTPVSLSMWSFGLFSIAVVIGLYLYFGEYTKRQTVDGLLVPDKGLITIYAKNPGVVVKKFVQQGEEVTKGQLLYLVSTEQESVTEQGIVAQQAALLEKQIEVQKNKIAMFEKKAASFEELLKQHYISEIEYQRHKDEYLSSKIQLNAYEKELSQVKGGGEYAIRAPEDGAISTLIAMVGGRVTTETQLGAMVPKGSQLEGELFVPTSKAGFVKIGQKVLLKYNAYPYQRFGLYEAVVSRIDKSVLSPQDIIKAFSLAVKQTDEVFYRVIVTLQKQTVTVYGQPYPLTAGMTLEGVILGDKRNIWQWVLEPIYSLRGNL
jgi:membrane fusion protein